MEHSMVYSLGFIVGVSIPFLLILLAVILFKKMGKNVGKHIYDERQQLAQGKAFKCGFYTFLICDVALTVVEVTGIAELNTSIAIFISMCISIIVFALVAIMKDAYIGVNHTPKSSLILFSVLAFVNLFFGISDVVSEGVQEMLGSPDVGSLNLICGITLLIITVALLVKMVQDKKENELL